MGKLRIFGLVSVVFASTAGLLVACSDDEPEPEVVIGAEGGDGGTDANGAQETGQDTGKPDTSKPDAALLPDGDCGDGEANPYCRPKVPDCVGVGPADHMINIEPFCNNCLRLNCCADMTACFGNGKVPGEGGIDAEDECIQIDICTGGCIGQPDAGGCVAECEATHTPSVVTAHRNAVSCINNECGKYPEWYKGGGDLCPQF